MKAITVLITLAGGAIGLYLLLLAGGFLFQRSLMYAPDPR